MSPILLTGPTASGKSAVAIELALRIGGEIISVDSMQVYRGLDIGTAKPSGDERARVPHHLMDVVGLDEPFDAARFVQLANAAIQDIEGRGRTAILCGGTGLYFNAWLGGSARLRHRIQIYGHNSKRPPPRNSWRNWPEKIR